MSARLARAVAVVAVAALAIVATASAHQTLVNNGVAVTMHIAPNDEPVAGEVAVILVPRVKTRTGTFAWATCRCRLTIMDSSSATLFQSAVKPRTEFTFPEPAAYSLTFAGRVRRAGHWRPFKVVFAIRADAKES